MSSKGYLYFSMLWNCVSSSDSLPQHDWGRYLNLVFSNTSVALQHDNVTVYDLPYLKKLSILLANTKPYIIGETL